MSTQENNPRVALYLLNRLALVATDVVQRHPGSEAIAMVGEALVPVAQQYVASFQGLRAARASQNALLVARDEEVGRLLRTVTTWTGPLIRDVPGFDASRFGNRPNVPLDVVANARALVELIEEQGGNLPYGERVQVLITERVQAAAAAIRHGQDARIALQTKQATTRELGAALQPHLVALRRVLRSELGSRHFDYQRMRAERARLEVEDGETDAVEADADVETDTAIATPTANGHTRAVAARTVPVT